MGNSAAEDLGLTDDFFKDVKNLTEEPSGEEPTEDGEPKPEEELAEETEEAPEGEGQEEEVAGAEDKVKPYTDEELLTILNDDGKLDSNRLTPAQKLIQRSFARHAEKGYQEIARIKRELEGIKKSAPQPQEQPKTIEEAFDRNPKEVLDWIDGQLAHMATEVDKDPLNAVKQIASLQATRNRLTDRQLNLTETKRNQRDTYESTLREVAEAVPDLAEKQGKLSDFAINELGYTEEELTRMTNPALGRLAVNTVRTINAAYDAKYGTKEKLSKSTDSKKVVKMPIVEGASKKESVSNPDAAKMRKAVENAKKNGDWTEVLNLKGVLQKITP